jgi:small conductance mechanosensitive channel
LQAELKEKGENMMLDKVNQQLLIDYGVRMAAIFLIILATFMTVKIVKKVLKKNERKIKIDKTQFKFMTHFLTGIIYFVGITLAIYSVPSLRTLATSIFAGSGVLALIIGFASQQAFSNIVSGIFIAIYKPFRIGDRLQVMGKGVSGIVEDINLRHTIIRTFENKRIILPNATINSDILENANIVDEKTCRFVDVGISYDSDIDKAAAIIKEEAKKHPDYLDVRTKEEKEAKVEGVDVKVVSFGDSSVNLRAWVWTKDPGAAFKLGCELNKRIKERFDKEGIEIPYPYRTVVMKS